MNKPPFVSFLKLDNLPNDIYHFYLFSYLTVNEVINLRFVNKRLLDKVNLYYVRELNFRNHFNFKNNWFSTNRSINLRIQLHIDRLGILRRSLQMLDKLRCLKINCVIKNNFKSDQLLKIEDLNKFSQLQILEIENFYLDPFKNHRLHLPDLRALSIENCIIGRGFYLLLDLPILNSLSMSEPSMTETFESTIRKVRFKYPLSVKYLQTLYYHHSSQLFKNLQCLQVSGMKSNEDVDSLLQFERLKKIRIVSSFFEVDKLRKFFNLKQKRSDLVIIFLGVPIRRANLIDEYLFLNHGFGFQKRYYNKLEPNLNFVNRINYTDLIPLLSQLTLDDQMNYFLTKFTNIQGIRIEREEVNEKILIQLIKSCNNLMYLWVYHSELSQNFYDQISLNAFLFRLHIRTNKTINFKFLMNITYLTHFYTNLNVKFVDDVNLNNLKYLREFCFYTNDGSVVIGKLDADRYSIKCSETLYDETNIGQLFNFSEVVQFWDELKRRRRLFSSEL